MNQIRASLQMSSYVLWLDVEANSNTAFCSKLLEYPLVKCFTSPDACIRHIEHDSMQNHFLIVSGALAKDIMAQLVNYDNITQIYVFCGSIGLHLSWAMDYVEKLLMFDHQDDLLQRLWHDMERDFRTRAQRCIEQAEESKERAQRYKQAPCG
jgi:hypothetical protein